MLKNTLLTDSQKADITRLYRSDEWYSLDHIGLIVGRSDDSVRMYLKEINEPKRKVKRTRLEF